jgi:NADH:ubiquinone oxidoreductase subunit E
MVTITICVGSSCYMRGSDDLASALEGLIEKAALQDQVEIIGSFCMGECSPGISIRVGDRQYREIHCEEAETFFYQEVLPHFKEMKE